MASTYTSDLRLNKQGIGDNNNTWGTVVNTQLDLLDNAISGQVTLNVTTGLDITLSTANGTVDQARQMILKLSGTPTDDISVIVPAVTKVYVIDATDLAGNLSVTIKPTAGNGVTFTAGQTGVVSCDGTDMIEIYRSTTAFVSGMIIMWSGTIATIPTGWVLCDGTNSSPDLRNQFVVGAQQDSAGVAKTNLTGSLTQSGGSLTTSASGGGTFASNSITLSLANLPAISFQALKAGLFGFVSYFAGSAVFGTDTYNVGGTATPFTTSTVIPDHTHTATPPYYALAFIMKT